MAIAAPRAIAAPFRVDPIPPTPYLGRAFERVAQPVEQLTFNQWVVGSSPTALTIDDEDFGGPDRWAG